MDKNYLIQLTNNLYRLTLLFPKKEPLRYKMRELADDILAQCLKSHFKQNSSLEENLETLNSFFEVAKNQNWVSSINILAIQAEYDKLKNELEKNNLSEERKEENLIGSSSLFEIQSQPVPTSRPLLERQEKILAFLKENGRAQVWQAKQILPEVTKRTLRRDFEYLLSQGLIERIGEKNDTAYQIKIKES